MKYLTLLFLLITAHLSWAQCGDTTHTTAAADTWTSCQASVSPNPARGSGHWIEYDLGYVYTLETLHVWNANQRGQTDRGFREVAIDYSLDGQQWTELGEYEWSEASGYQSETGQTGADFAGVRARYVLVSGLSNWGDAHCYGLAELRFGLEEVTAADLVEAEGAPLRLFPNPTAGPLTIETGALRPMTLRLVDLKGRVVREFEGTIPTQLDVADLPRGLYFVSLQDDQGRYHSGGFVKE